MIGVMTYSKIAENLKVSKVTVHQDLKKAINKTYKGIRKDYAENELDALIILLSTLNITENKDVLMDSIKMIELLKMENELLSEHKIILSKSH